MPRRIARGRTLQRRRQQQAGSSLKTCSSRATARCSRRRSAKSPAAQRGHARASSRAAAREAPAVHSLRVAMNTWRRRRDRRGRGGRRNPPAPSIQRARTAATSSTSLSAAVRQASSWMRRTATACLARVVAHVPAAHVRSRGTHADHLLRRCDAARASPAPAGGSRRPKKPPPQSTRRCSSRRRRPRRRHRRARARAAAGAPFHARPPRARRSRVSPAPRDSRARARWQRDGWRGPAPPPSIRPPPVPTPPICVAAAAAVGAARPPASSSSARNASGRRGDSIKNHRVVVVGGGIVSRARSATYRGVPPSRRCQAASVIHHCRVLPY